MMGLKDGNSPKEASVMSWKRSAIAVAAGMAAAMSLSSTAGAAGSCRKNCDDAYSACMRAGGSEQQCRGAWRACTQQCSAAPKGKPKGNRPR